jgi:hypothetical protein
MGHGPRPGDKRQADSLRLALALALLASNRRISDLSTSGLRSGANKTRGAAIKTQLTFNLNTELAACDEKRQNKNTNTSMMPAMVWSSQKVRNGPQSGL